MRARVATLVCPCPSRWVWCRVQLGQRPGASRGACTPPSRTTIPPSMPPPRHIPRNKCSRTGRSATGPSESFGKFSEWDPHTQFARRACFVPLAIATRSEARKDGFFYLYGRRKSPGGFCFGFGDRNLTVQTGNLWFCQKCICFLS